MKITQSLVRKPEVQSINAVMSYIGKPSIHGASLSQIVAEAKKFLFVFQ